MSHKWVNGINHAPELKIGWRYRWGSKAMGFHQTVVKNILTIKPWWSFLAPKRSWTYFEIETFNEPTGYPEKGSLYGYPSMSGVFWEFSDEIQYPLSYGVFIEVMK